MSKKEKTPSPGTGQWSIIQPWLSFAMRLVLAGVMLWSGWSKIIDLDESVRSVHAYQILPSGLADIVGYVLPVAELALGVVLLIGLLTRYGAIVNGLLMIAFMIGIASVWVRGISIDCGCFGGGGTVDAEQTQYLWELIRDCGLLLGSVYLAIWPRSRFSADHALKID